MKTCEDCPSPYGGPAEQSIVEDEALKQGMAAKSKDFVENGAEVYAKV